MKKALVISDKDPSYFIDLIEKTTDMTVYSAADLKTACDRIKEEHIDLFVIFGTLGEGPGEKFAIELVRGYPCEVILIPDTTSYDKVTQRVQKYGVLTIPGPVNDTIFRLAISFAVTFHNKVRSLHLENMTAKREIEDIKMVDRAKCILISRLSMTENEAHKYIEKRSMDTRRSRRKIAEDILRTYEY